MTLIAALGVDRTKNWVAKNHGTESAHYQLLEQFGPQIIATVTEHFSSKPFNVLQNIATGLAQPQASGPAIGYQPSDAETVYRQAKEADVFADSIYKAMFPTEAGFRAHNNKRTAAMVAYPKLLKQAAEMGHREAQYEWGVENARERPEAMRLLAMAAAQGHARAEAKYNELAELERAEHPAIEAPAQQRQQQPATSTPNAATIAGLLRSGMTAFNRGDLAQAFRDWEQAALAGDANGMNNIADMFHNGEYVAQDYKRAAEWWTKAAGLGHADAQHELADLYRKGDGVPQNLTEAVRLWRIAAEAKHPPAQCSLGLALFRGYGVNADREQAIQWLEKAAAQHNKRAERLLPEFRAEMERERREREARRESDAREGGNLSRKEAMDLLGLSEPFTPDDVKRQHKAIVQREHPDHGGNTYIMQLANRARDTLLKA